MLDKGGYKTAISPSITASNNIEEKLLKSKHIIPDVGKLEGAAKPKEKGKRPNRRRRNRRPTFPDKPAVGSRRSKRLYESSAAQ